MVCEAQHVLEEVLRDGVGEARDVLDLAACSKATQINNNKPEAGRVSAPFPR